MLTRREFLNQGLVPTGAAAIAAGCCGNLFEIRRPVVRFGCVSDTHYAEIPDRPPTKFFSKSLHRMRDAVREFKHREVDFVIELGDLIDSGEQDNLKVSRSLAKIEAAFSAFCGTAYHVSGNHDFGSLTEREFYEGINGRGHYSFQKNGITFIVLDGCYTATGVHYSAMNFSWKDANVPKGQLDWLKGVLSAARGVAVVFCHFPLVGADEDHRLRNAEDVVRIIESSGKVKSCFSGHYHLGGYCEQRGCTYRIVRAQVDKWDNAVLVSVYEDGFATMEYIEP